MLVTVNIRNLEACCDFTHGHISVFAVSFIPVTIRENTVNDLN